MEFNWDLLKEAVQNYAEYVRSDQFNPDRTDDYENDIFEAAVDAVLGEEWWNELNGRIDEVDR